MLRTGDELVPGYKLQNFLGRGGFGEVWSARAPGGVRAALKSIHLEGKNGLKEYNAVQRLKNLQHPHLLPINALWLLDQNHHVVDTDRYEGEQDTWSSDEFTNEQPRPAMLVLAMPLAEKSLFELLEQHQNGHHPGVPIEDLLNYMEDVAKGLDFLNNSDIGDSDVSMQHCDVKPHNILLVGKSAMICDFGLARLLNDGRTSKNMSASPAYAAPELLKTNKPSASTDQYSLAITYYELRTGQLPFPADSPAAIYEAHLQGQLDLSGLSDGEQEVILRATAINPTDRYSTTSGLVRDLRHALKLYSNIDPRVTVADSRDYGDQPIDTVDESTNIKQTLVMGAGIRDTLPVNSLGGSSPQRGGPKTKATTGRAQNQPNSPGLIGAITQMNLSKLLIAGAVLAAIVAGYALYNPDDESEENGDETVAEETEDEVNDDKDDEGDTKSGQKQDDADNLALLKAGDEENISKATAFFEAGNEFNKQKKDNEAVTEYTKAIDLAPADRQLMYKLFNRRAVARRKIGDQENKIKALDDFQQAAEYAADDKIKSLVFYARGLLLQEMNRLDEAIEDFSQTISFAPESELGYDERAKTYRLRGAEGDESKAEKDDTEIKVLRGEIPANAA